MATHPKAKKPGSRRGAPRGETERELMVVVLGLVEARRRGLFDSEMSSLMGWFSEKCGWSVPTIKRRLREIDPPLDIDAIIL